MTAFRAPEAALRSPASGLALRRDGAHALTDGATRWPVVDGIACLRTGRDALYREVLHCLDREARREALVLLLADQDDWWRGPTASAADLRQLVDEAAALSLRDAMGLLAWGPVADYFAHRWSDPTFLAGLALVDAHWNAPRRAFELACGIGHHLRALAGRGVAVAGADVVFAKLWLARHFVVPEASLLCFDAGAAWPVEAASADLVACHDAFYFLPGKAAIGDRLRGMLGPSGLLAVSHVHNRDWPNGSAGDAVTADEIAALFPDATFYDDAELTRALVDARAPRPAPAEALGGAEAFSLVAGSLAAGPGGGAPRAIGRGGFAMPADGTALRRNPLYAEGGAIRFPSERYAREYGPRATYRDGAACPERAVAGPATETAARRRELVDLPARW